MHVQPRFMVYRSFLLFVTPRYPLIWSRAARSRRKEIANRWMPFRVSLQWEGRGAGEEPVRVACGLPNSNKRSYQELCCYSVTKLCLTLCYPKDCSMPGSSVNHLQEFAQTHVHWVSDAIEPSQEHSIFYCINPFNLPNNFMNQKQLLALIYR